MPHRGHRSDDHTNVLISVKTELLTKEKLSQRPRELSSPAAARGQAGHRDRSSRSASSTPSSAGNLAEARSLQQVIVRR